MRDAAVAWMVQQKRPGDFWYPVTAESRRPAERCRRRARHRAGSWDALNSATAPIVEGNVGGGTGMICNGFKGGTGTSSRRLSATEGGYTLGVLVQCNYGNSQQLRVAGIPVAREMNLQPPCVAKLSILRCSALTESPLWSATRR